MNALARRWLLDPLHDFMQAFERSLPEPPWAGLGAILLGAAAGWWVYVPVHELFHAFGCIATGGTVQRLEISAQYGAAMLRRVFPFVAVGSDYAGQLTGFETHGNDLIYLATVFAPYLLTVLIGVPLLRRLGRAGQPGPGRCFVMGATLPVAYASFYNVPGDYYELGSIVVSRLVAAITGADPARWRSDDVIKLAGELLSDGPGPADVTIVVVSALLGLFLALATYRLGSSLGR